MRIEAFEAGPLPTNCYFLTDEATGKTAVIDPGAYDSQIQRAAQSHDVAMVLLTHGHFDHIMGVGDLVARIGAKVYLDAADAAMVRDPRQNLSGVMRLGAVKPFTPDVLLHDGDTFPLGSLRIRVLHTPGHTPGGCCYLAEDALFSGDTLMGGSAGRTDFPGGDYRALLASLQKLKALPGDWRVFPGHGPESTLDWERRNNPYLEPERYGLTT